MIKLQCWVYVFPVKKITVMYSTIMRKTEREREIGLSNHCSFTNLQSYNAPDTKQRLKDRRKNIEREK